MSYPPEFSSTATYENRYDLDEIDVFIESNSTNPMYLQVEGITNKIFAYGKHYFTISLLNPENQLHQLRPGSRVLFEFKSINNVILKSDVIDVDQANGLINCYFEVLKDPKRTYKEVQDGDGTLTIVGSLENKSSTDENNFIPKKFENAMNYRCVFPINIRKNALNASSSTITNITHEQLTHTGKFSFKSNAIPSLSKDPNVGSNYNDSGDKTTTGGYSGALTD